MSSWLRWRRRLSSARDPGPTAEHPPTSITAPPAASGEAGLSTTADQVATKSDAAAKTMPPTTGVTPAAVGPQPKKGPCTPVLSRSPEADALTVAGASDLQTSAAETSSSSLDSDAPEWDAARPSLGDISGRWRRILPRLDTQPTPGLRADDGSTGHFEFAAASLVGKLHLHHGRPSDDAYSHRLISEDRLCVAVADGVGSLPGSGAAARLAAKTVCESYPTVESGEESGLRAAFALANQAVISLARDDLLATTLIAAVCTRKPRTGEMLSLIVRAGDGGAWVLGPDRSLRPALPPSPVSSEVVSAALPQVPAEPEVVAATIPRGSSLILATDGVAEDITYSPEIHDWLAARLTAELSAIKLSIAISYDLQGSADDRTVVVVKWPFPADARSPVG